MTRAENEAARAATAQEGHAVATAALLLHVRIGYARIVVYAEPRKTEIRNSHWCAQGVVICLLIGWETGFNYQLDTDNSLKLPDSSCYLCYLDNSFFPTIRGS